MPNTKLIEKPKLISHGFSLNLDKSPCDRIVLGRWLATLGVGDAFYVTKERENQFRQASRRLGFKGRYIGNGVVVFWKYR